ncbi:MAG: hypothetical protein KatS3mg044_0526 [Rhodothermaceae bacterium]|nr:MAG: hypothetical protein KatS3mg044_0526 [Rhodothermaceae bacterium]
MKRLLPFLVFSLLAFPTAGQKLPPGPQVLTFFSDVDDTEQPYAIYLPPDFDATRRYPLVVSLHGAGSNHRLNLRRVFGKSNTGDETDVEASRYFPAWDDVDFIVVSPYARGTMGYEGIAEKDVLDVVADVRRRFPIDENRMYLTGLSMGGGGTLWIGLSRPDLWAALAPVCPAPPPGVEMLAPNALNLPVHFFQGGADPVVRPEGTRAWVDRLDALGTQVAYEEYEGVGHDSWVQAYEGGRIFDWFARFERNPYPERVRFVTARYAARRAYWVRLDAFTPGTPARIDARFTATNRLRIDTDALEGFTLSLTGHPHFDAGHELVVELDGVRLAMPAADSVSFHRDGERWRIGMAPARGKRPGAEGPLTAAVAGRHVYVYGTAGEPSEDVLAARRAVAERAGNWSVYRGPFLNRVMVFPRIIPDQAVRPSDVVSGSLVLFGTPATNHILARLADRLPLHLDEEATDRYGLVYVYPHEGHYVLVNAGRPWWEAPDEGTFRFGMGVAALRLPDDADFLLFDAGTGRILAHGRFDDAWRLPPDAAEALRATGIVRVAPHAEPQR